MIAAIVVSCSAAIILSVFSSLMVNDSERAVRFSPSVLCEQVADICNHSDGERVLVAVIVDVEASAPGFLVVPFGGEAEHVECVRFGCNGGFFSPV